MKRQKSIEGDEFLPLEDKENSKPEKDDASEEEVFKTCLQKFINFIISNLQVILMLVAVFLGAMAGSILKNVGPFR